MRGHEGILALGATFQVQMETMPALVGAHRDLSRAGRLTPPSLIESICRAKTHLLKEAAEKANHLLVIARFLAQRISNDNDTWVDKLTNLLS